MKTENEMKLRNEIEKPVLVPVPVEQAKIKLENFEEYRCVVISVDDETPMPYYDEAIVELKYHKEGNVFVDNNDNDWGIDEILYVYMPSSEIERLKEENDKKCIEFAEWIDRVNVILLENHNENKKWIYKGERHTTQKLLTLFNNRS